MRKGAKENIIITGLTGATLLSGAFLTLPRVSAEPNTETVDRITITVPSSCSLSSTVDNPTHTATVHNREYVEDIGETTIKAVCNDINGFSVYAIGFSDDTDGKTVLSASTVDHTNDIVTGLATEGDTSNWAMRLSSVDGTYAPTIENGFDEYSEVPATYTKVATFTSRTDQSLGSSLKTNYAVYVSGSQLADTYTGKVKYTIVHPHNEPAPLSPKTTASGKICYYPSFDATASDDTMGCQTIPDSGETDGVSPTSATLLASNFSRDGYGFAGWSDKFDYATNNEAKFYGPQETITFTAGQYTGSNNGLSLYAVWVKSAGSLQDATKVAELCGTGANALTTAPTNGTANLSSVSALTDQRDHQTYAIAKLADGKCWMIENLRLESTAEHNTDGTLAQGYHSSFAGLANAESANFSDSTTANSLYSTDGSTIKTIDSAGGNLGYRFPRYNNTNTFARVSSPTDNSVAMYSYGNYYTWHAAIADTTHHNGSNNTSSDTTSICPKGWRLPRGGPNTVTSGQNGDFYVLTTTISGTTPNNANSGYAYYSGTVEGVDVGKLASDSLRGYPNNFLYSGLFNGSSASNRGSYGYYWSSTAYIYNSSFSLNLDSSSVNPGTGSYIKYYGYSIRCVSGS